MPVGTTETINAPSSNIAADLPSVDFAKLTGTPKEQKEALKQLDHAFQTFGFIYLEAHSIPQVTVDKAFAWSKRFFALPENIKQTIAHPPSGEWDDHRGFAEEGLGHVTQLVWDHDEVAKQRKEAPERKQTLEMGNPYPQSRAAPNKWLEEHHLPGFRGFVEKWWDECTKLERSLLRCLGQILRLDDEDYLCRRQSQDLCHMSFAFYPSMPISVLKSGQQKRLNAHTDFGGLTLLFQDMVGGLEVHDGSVFRPVVPRRGSIILNVGDMLERQSNGRWKSALHRVVAPQDVHMQQDFAADNDVVDRYSIIYFGQPDPESMVDTLPGCEKSGKWKPNMIGDWAEVMTAGEWLAKRVAFEY